MSSYYFLIHRYFNLEGSINNGKMNMSGLSGRINGVKF